MATALVDSTCKRRRRNPSVERINRAALDAIGLLSMAAQTLTNCTQAIRSMLSGRASGSTIAVEHLAAWRFARTAAADKRGCACKQKRDVFGSMRCARFERRLIDQRQLNPAAATAPKPRGRLGISRSRLLRKIDGAEQPDGNPKQDADKDG